MVFIQVKDSEDKTIRLEIDENKLIVGDEETFELDSVYGVDKTDTQLIVHLTQKRIVTEQEAVAATENKNLLNIRPGDILWDRRTLRFGLVDQENDAFIEKLKIPFLADDKKAVVFINPVSGTQQAKTQWKNTVKPMLLEAGIRDDNIQHIFTEGNGKTRTLAEHLGKQLKESKQVENTIIICMGGDGTLHEVVNGLADSNMGAREEEINTTYRVGVVPVGSGNAFSLSLNIESVEHAVLKIIRGITGPFYMMHVKLGHSTEQDNWQSHVEFKDDAKPIRLLVVMSWGFHAQIVSKARYLRYFMGNIRFSLVARFLLYFLKQYKGDLLIRKGARYDPTTQSFTNNPDSDDILLSSSDEKSFTYFIASKQHSLEKGFNISPFASPLTPDVDLVILRGATAEALMTASMQAFQGGQHVKDSAVEYYKTSSDFLLRVDEKTELCLDGEICDLPAKGIVQLSMIGPANEPTFLTFV